jgi:hypothetical protein
MGPAVHAAGLALLVAGCAAAASGLAPASPAAARAAFALAWALGLHGLLLVTARVVRRGPASSPRDYGRALALLVLAAATFAFYLTPNRVGPIDAQWYGQVMTDFLAQSRSGRFPVLVGTTLYAFNGAVHPFRSAPWQFVLAHGLDRLTGRALAPLALQHL